MLKLDFITDAWEASNWDKKPKGVGSWAFAETRNGTPIFAPSGLTLTAAKKWLKDELKSWGIEGDFEVWILP
jgi:hypothetical protein